MGVGVTRIPLLRFGLEFLAGWPRKDSFQKMFGFGSSAEAPAYTTYLKPHLRHSLNSEYPPTLASSFGEIIQDRDMFGVPGIVLSFGGQNENGGFQT